MVTCYGCLRSCGSQNRVFSSVTGRALPHFSETSLLAGMKSLTLLELLQHNTGEELDRNTHPSRQIFENVYTLGRETEERERAG